MHFLIDYQLKLIFGFSAKCGCTTVKKVFLENTTDYKLRKIYLKNIEVIESKAPHFKEAKNRLPYDISNFKIILFIRNPYERIISGCLNKYTYQHSQYRHNWKQGLENLTFNNFVNTITDEGLGKQIDRHHFTPQTTEEWSDRLLKHSDLIVMDIKNIDYSILNDVFKTNTIKEVRQNQTELKGKNIIDNAWNIQIDELLKMSPDYTCLYNNELKEKVYNFYKKDFETFKKLGFDYDI